MYLRESGVPWCLCMLFARVQASSGYLHVVYLRLPLSLSNQNDDTEILTERTYIQTARKRGPKICCHPTVWSESLLETQWVL